MTVQEKFEQKVYEMGVFPNDAKAIVEAAKVELDAMSPLNWDSPASGYPEQIYQIGMLTVKRVGLDWIEQNKPNAWFKAMFQD